MGSVHVICISLLFFKLLYYSPPTVKFYFYCHASFKKITDSFFSVLSRPRFFHSCNHGQKVLGHFSVSACGVLQFTQVQPQQTTDNKQCWTRVSRIFSQFQLCIGWGGGGRTARKFRKVMHSCKREPTNDRKI